MTHKDLEVWKAAMELTKLIYKVTSWFPKEEIYGLTAQMRRASISIPSNIAEGAARSSNKEFYQFLHIALGSLSELETQWLLAQELGFVNQVLNAKHDPLPVIDYSSLISSQIENVRRMLLGLIRHLKNRL